MRDRLLCLLLALMPARGRRRRKSRRNIPGRTKDLRLYYYDSLSYLVPHAVRTFTNSLAWQRRMFGWAPSEPTIVLLQDFADYGNASAYAAPHSMLVFDVAPLSHAFETFPASERMYQLMNHELVHVVQGDMATEEDRRWRRFFLGKVDASVAQNPESLLYSYLTIPRFTAPRWYLEGGAVFMETWMGGGLGRAQGGYDEMVFRAMVRDDAHFYDPLGLASRGIARRFPDRRERVPLRHALLHLARVPLFAGEGRRLAQARRRERALLLRPISEGVRPSARAGLAGLDRVRARVPATQPRRSPQVPDHAASNAGGQPRSGSVSRTYYDEATGILYGGFRYPGVVEYVGALNTRDGSITAARRHQAGDALQGDIVRLRPGSGTAFFTNDNRGDLTSRPDGGGRADRRGTDALENARVGEIVVDPVDRSLMGVRHDNGLATLVRIPKPYDHWYSSTRFRTASCPTTSTFRRTGGCCRRP